LPQRPHDPPSFCRSRQPKLEHEVSPGRHTHAPPLQACRDEQLAPQAPHCLGSVTRSRHSLPHAAAPLGQVQALEAQDANVGHTAPHAPQFFGSFVASTQTPPQ
jgi:hypothetical protein